MSGYPMRVIPGYVSSRPGIQVGTKLEGKVELGGRGKLTFDEAGIRFLKQIGVEWVMVNDVPEHSAACYKQIVEQLYERGLKVYRLANHELHNMPDVTLNLSRREEMIDRYLQYIADLGEAGIRYATYAHMGNGIWRGDFRREVRGGATAGGLDLGAPSRSVAFGDFSGELTHGRPYSEDELWENYEYFIRKVVPVAEASRVYIGIHPDDPPFYAMGGIPRRMFGTAAGYKRAFEIADSAFIGACLCVGCWLEGGDETGMSAEEFIRYLAGENKLFKLHMRNVTAPLSAPGGFNETFPDAGYGDLIGCIRALHETGFDGAIMNDHLIDMVGGHYACEAYFTAYLKGAVDGVQGAAGAAYSADGAKKPAASRPGGWTRAARH